jgi:hypothetical protein
MHVIEATLGRRQQRAGSEYVRQIASSRYVVEESLPSTTFG